MGLITLIEVSSRAHTPLDNLKFCTDSVVHPRIEMCSMLKYLISPSMFKDDDRDVILKMFETRQIQVLMKRCEKLTIM